MGKIQYVSRFIAKLTSMCEIIFKLLRKNKPIVWNEQCEEALEKIKQYLTNPPVMKPLRPGKPLILYLAVESKALWAMLV